MTFPNGFLIIDKPTGATSFSMVALMRRLTGVRRVGHAGTLDPMATGVLPVAIGQATRFIEYLDDAPKVYIARIRFGATTDTYDAQGTVTATADASGVTRGALENLLPTFTGVIDQVPPAFSALKVAGKAMYRYARAGEVVQIPARSVRIDGISVLSFEPGSHPEAEIEIACGKGTYIRSLAHDLGQLLGVGAHLTALRRTATGGFDLRLARSTADVAALADAGNLEGAVLAVDRAVERRRAAILDVEHAIDVRAGRDVTLRIRPEGISPEQDELCRAYDTHGSFMGVLRYRGRGSWHPAKVLPNA